MNQPPQDEKNFRWGLAGHDQWGSVSGHSLAEGVVRTVVGGVVYTPPPKEAELRCWQQLPANPQQFEMPWAGDPRNIQSLHDLGQELRKERATANDPRLSELNQAADSLLRCADRLHKRDFGLGLVNPRNVLVVPGKEGEDILLSDLGFCWNGGPVRPDWLRSNEFELLWDNKPQDQQHITGGPIAADEKKKADLRTLARLFACVLTGTPQRDIQDHPPATSQNHQKENVEVLNQVWRTLAAAVRGEFNSAGEFADRLKTTPLSGHFIAEPPPNVTWPSSRAATDMTGRMVGNNKARWLLQNILLLMGIAALVLLLSLALWKLWPTGRTEDGSPSRPGNGANFESLVKKFADAGDAERAAILVEMCRKGVAKNQEQLQKREKLRGEFVARWKDRYSKAANENVRDLQLTFECRQKVDALRGELKMLQEHPSTDPSLDREEKQCLTLVELLLGQYYPGTK